MNNSIPYSLTDEINYKSELLYYSFDYFKIYKQLLDTYINEYVKSSFTNAFYRKNPTFYYYLLEKGISTVSHVFNILLIYTKHIDLVEYHCTKVIYYYIEFIGRNEEQDENKINYTNASIFCYSKTIYNLNKTYKKIAGSDNEKNILYNINNMIILYQTLLRLFNNTQDNHTQDNHTQDNNTQDNHTQDNHTQDNHTQDNNTHLFPNYITNHMEKYMSHILNLSEYDENNEINITDRIVVETIYYYKITFIIDFLSVFNIRGSEIIKYIDKLFIIVQKKKPTILNIPALITKISSDENK